MVGWIPKEQFGKTEYGKLNLRLDPKKYFGLLDRSKLPPGSTIVPYLKDGYFGIIKGPNGEPLGEVDLG